MDLILLVVVAMLFIVVDQVRSVRKDTARLSGQVERLMERVEVGFATQGLVLPERPEVAAVRALVAEQKTVEAVRLWRNATGASLTAAKHKVDQIAHESS